MGDFPGKINNITISVKKEEFPPRGRPIKGTKCREELNNTDNHTSLSSMTAVQQGLEAARCP